MFCQNETLCTFDVLKRDDAASPDAFQLNNSKKKKKKHNKLFNDFINLGLNESILSKIIPSCAKWHPNKFHLLKFFRKGVLSQIDNYSITVSILPEFIETI